MAESTEGPINVEVFLTPSATTGGGAEQAAYERPAVQEPGGAARPSQCLCKCGSLTGAGSGGAAA